MATFWRLGPNADISHVKAVFLARVERAVRAGGGVGVYVTSGYRSPGHNAAVGGASRSNHLTGDALDGYAILPGGGQVPLGTFLAKSAGSFGLRSGASFNWGGRPDVVHVDDAANQGGGGVSPAPSSSVSTLDGFFTLVLRNLGAPVNTATLGFLRGWSQVEGTAAKNNPLATTQREPGSVDLPGNSAHVQQYPTPELGAAATAQTLRSYPHIVAALKSGSPQVGGITPGLVSDFNRWSGGGGVTYAKKVFNAAVGNPKGSSAADIGSYDLGNAYQDSGAKTVVDAALSVPRFLAKITDPHNILRGLQVVAGAGLVLTGTVLLARQVALAADLPDPAKIVGGRAAGAVE